MLRRCYIKTDLGYITQLFFAMKFNDESFVDLKILSTFVLSILPGKLANCVINNEIKTLKYVDI